MVLIIEVFILTPFHKFTVNIASKGIKNKNDLKFPLKEHKPYFSSKLFFFKNIIIIVDSNIPTKTVILFIYPVFSDKPSATLNNTT
jgi:hypothetical protein